jgi:hypothetical protein
MTHYCDACAVARAVRRFILPRLGPSAALDMCGHHANRERDALLADGWVEQDIPEAVAA